jgi:HK97 family phage major capsid protein
MRTLKLLKDYGDFKAGDIVDVKEADAEYLIEQETAEVHIELTKHADAEARASTDAPEDPATVAAKAAVEILKASGALSTGLAIPAQAIDRDEKFKFTDKGFFEAVKEGDMATLQPYLNYVQEKATGNAEAIDSEGGYLIPTELSNEIWEGIKTASVVRPKCMDTPINNAVDFPYVDDFDKSSSWWGGVTTHWISEGVAPTLSKLKFGKYMLKLKKLGAYLAGTEELLADSPQGFEQLVTTGASYAIAKTVDEVIINGTGAGTPLGLMNSGCLISVTAEGSQPATTIVTNNILKMRMRCSNFRVAEWHINEDCYQQIATLYMAVGTGGIPMKLANLTDEMNPRLLGRPIVWSDHCQTLGTTGDIILGDFSQYHTASKAGQPGVKGQSSIHVKFLEGETVWRFTIRVDGHPRWKKELTPKHGSSTKSPFVALATRS